MNNPFAKSTENREVIPGAKIKTGLLATQEPHEYVNQALFAGVTDHVWGTSAQAASDDATFYTDASGNPLDKSAVAVTINEDDKILIAHDVTATANMTLICGGKKVRLEMLQGVNWNLSTFDLTLGETGDSFSGDIELTGTGTLTIEESNGLRVNHTAMTIVNMAGDAVVNHLSTSMIIWRMTNNESAGSQDPLGGGGSDWEVSDDTENEFYLGSVDQVVETSGIFSFASTGIWSIRAYARVEGNAVGLVTFGINSTNDNSTYATIASGYRQVISGGLTDSVGCEALIKVVDITLDKIKLAQGMIISAFCRGSTSQNETYIVFTKLSDL